MMVPYSPSGAFGTREKAACRVNPWVPRIRSVPRPVPGPSRWTPPMTVSGGFTDSAPAAKAAS